MKKIVMDTVTALAMVGLQNVFVMKASQMMALISVQDVLIQCSLTLTSVSLCKDNMLFSKKIMNAAKCLIKCLISFMIHPKKERQS